MGDVISLVQRRALREARHGGAGGGGPRSLRVVFYFDLACPFSHLAAERVDRLLPLADWCPASAEGVVLGDSWEDEVSLRGRAERRAVELRIPLLWPERFPLDAWPAMRAAAYAAEAGRGASFVLAASRLAYCGGFGLEDPETLAEAAAAARLGLDQCLLAAGDRRRDAAIKLTGRRLLAAGGDRPPAVRVGGALFCGEARVADAAAFVRRGAGMAVTS